jgi:hypothetical protein
MFFHGQPPSRTLAREAERLPRGRIHQGERARDMTSADSLDERELAMLRAPSLAEERATHLHDGSQALRPVSAQMPHHTRPLDIRCQPWIEWELLWTFHTHMRKVWVGTVEHHVVFWRRQDTGDGQRQGRTCLDPGIAKTLGAGGVRIRHPVVWELCRREPGDLRVLQRHSVEVTRRQRVARFAVGQHFEHGQRNAGRGIHHTHTWGVPAAPGQIRPLAAQCRARVPRVYETVHNHTITP